MFDRLAFLLAETWHGIRRHPTMAFASVTTIAITLFLLGGLALLYVQINAFAVGLTGKFEMRAFAVDGTSRPEISNMARQMREIPGVKTVAWIPRDKAWERERQNYPAAVTEGIENPLPDAFKITLSDLKASDGVVEALQRVPNIDREAGIQYLKAEQQFVEQSRSLLAWLAWALGGLLTLTSGILIYNSIRMSIHSRRREMRVMRLVGASRISVNTPFVLEGLVQGAAGGLLAALLLFASYGAIIDRLTTLSLLSAAPPFPLGFALGTLAGIGAAYGAFCSVIALFMPQKP